MTKKINVLAIFLVLLLGCTNEKKDQSQTDDAQAGTVDVSNEIVFVCTHGAARSPIAANYFNRLAEENNLEYRAVHRATKPDATLTKETIEGLTADGFDLSGQAPAQVSNHDVENAFRVISFDCEPPTGKNENIQWNGTPSISDDYGIARDAIKMKVENLVAELAKE